jgi:hypothetical protein
LEIIYMIFLARIHLLTLKRTIMKQVILDQMSEIAFLK